MTDTSSLEASSTEADLKAEGVHWDLSALISPDTDPVAYLRKADVLVDDAEQYKERLSEPDADIWAALMRTVGEIHSIVGRAGSYVGLQFSVAMDDPEVASARQAVEEATTLLASRLVFIELAFAALDDSAAETLMADDRLAFCAHHLGQIRAQRSHMLTEEVEQALIETSVTRSSAWVRLFSELTSAILVQLDGETIGLEQALSKLADPDRNVRRQAASAVTKGLETTLNTRAFVYNALLAEKSVSDRMRNYPSWISSRNLSNEATDESVTALISAVTERFDIAQRWYELKANLLNIESLSYYDRMAPVADFQQEVGWLQATEIVTEAYRSFSPQLADIATEFIDKNWIDAPTHPGKRPGAFCAYTVSDHHPYVLLNWTGTPRDVSTLAHELGHGMHAYLARRQGVFHQATPLTVAETASVFGEAVTNNRLLQLIDDPKEKLSLSAAIVDDSIATVFRQVAMWKFEDRCHSHRRSQGELSVEQFNTYWIETQSEMMGSTVQLSDEYQSWWSYIPHFMGTPGYVYAYAYGQLLALSVYARYRTFGDDFVPSYIEMLCAGGSVSPGELASLVDCDLTDPQFWKSGLDIIDEQLADAQTAASEIL